MNFGKVLTAMVTPFDQDQHIDFNRTTELVNYLIDHGSDGLVISGTTGESPTLSLKERLQLFEHVVKVVDKRVPVIAGTGDNNTKDSIAFTKEAEKTGVDASLLVNPYYNKPSQQGLLEHFTAIANETKLPIMLYNIPSRTAVQMSVDTVVQLSQVSNIVSIKESSGDLDAVSEIIERTDEGFTVYSGDDSLTLPILSVGGDGVVSVAAHVIGDEMKQMIEAFEVGDVKTAAKIHRELLPIMNAMFLSPSPTPVKEALQLKGINVGDVRLPLVPLSFEQRKTLEQILENR
ncbi:4-hydroxy-tetrahydrodipicolinate synthase [Aquibacillus sediminis]|uniref:4-hydroxy-tetrahydrodipicolinate synthase n=1 Tax=Aquibacillus sediminis TaxID=2574734 RepID=UPI00110962FC|nr:4-hydroxy-tetrahydrodipicolinate synthase [Aquibacillus sediminis]